MLLAPETQQKLVTLRQQLKDKQGKLRSIDSELDQYRRRVTELKREIQQSNSQLKMIKIQWFQSKRASNQQQRYADLSISIDDPKLSLLEHADQLTSAVASALDFTIPDQPESSPFSPPIKISTTLELPPTLPHFTANDPSIDQEQLDRLAQELLRELDVADDALPPR